LVLKNGKYIKIELSKNKTLAVRLNIYQTSANFIRYFFHKIPALKIKNSQHYNDGVNNSIIKFEREIFQHIFGIHCG
jgi:hypothetical protein